MKNIFLLSLFFLSIACSKTQVEAEKANCKITEATFSTTKKLRFEYDGERIKKVTYFISGYVYDINLVYDNSGRLSATEWFRDGVVINNESFTYSGDKISRVDYLYTDGYDGFNELEYNAAGQITKFTYDNEGATRVPYYTFDYDSNGSLIKTEHFGLDGDLVLRKIVKPMNLVKSPESLIISAGMPYDLFYGLPFKSVLGGDGTIIETYYPNSDGDLELFTTGVVSESNVSSSNYLESYLATVTGGSSFTNSTKYTLEGCN
ncbi:hypothetical protein [Arcticibacterium luteifluviistationis]|uniref:DUF4595 domain-containing protein n=1 Tax=Arcticibacterium luteifluviistationis TaxID=1784714 RepID=A0A2Z4G6B6_9BACT|nr:hypothetical protein [Arcticibacterium luteifluviistationis]AWV96679.1 hypothetical protein DJ013_00095 [Arcticibacterium luteifluviistationis]